MQPHIVLRVTAEFPAAKDMFVMSIKMIMPVWMREYRLSSARGDFVAGSTLAAYAIPVAIAYSSLAGQAGLYC